MIRRELAPYAVAALGVLTGSVVACNEARRAQGLEERLDKVVRAQVLQQDILCRQLDPNLKTRAQCKKLLEEAYKDGR